VTHLETFAQGLFRRASGNTLFLRAEREADGTRTFRMVEGGPLGTSYGRDLYDRIFAPEVEKRPALDRDGVGRR
jgi:hypothetical protein